ncbi:hypothetical protein K6T82_23930 [Flavobacterium sp. 17A]|uniref:Uncharacterized protein n=1 Tax=Flavobacterium potami TaxID=2872310 RepID=A0A9X1HG59_9FLAO|nr:hypothetical protein [Flavobacterium potami]MBZ4037828.1 hypothetical protein [Flavobacterium potami]
MKNLNFPNYQEEVSIVNITPSSMLKGFESLFEDDQFNEMTIEEKLLILVLDRDGYFFSKIKPLPSFLILLKKHGIFVEAFVFYNEKARIYACFLKTFIENSEIKNYKELYNK